MIRCPRCLQDLRVRGEYRGRKVECRFCGEQFLVEIDTTAELSTASESAMLELVTMSLASEAAVAATATIRRDPDARLARTRVRLQVARNRARLLEQVLAQERVQARRVQDELRGHGAAADGDPARARLEAERDEARAERDRIREEQRTLESGFATARAEIERMGRDLETLCVESRRLGEEREAVALVREEFRTRIADRERALALREAELLRAHDNLDSHQRDEQDRLDRDGCEAAAQADRLRSELAAARREGSALIRRCEIADAEADRLRAVVEQFAHERQHLVRAASESARLWAERDAEARALLARLDEVEMETRSRIAALDTELEHHRRRAEACNLERAAAGEWIAALEEDNQRLEDEARARRAEPEPSDEAPILRSLLADSMRRNDEKSERIAELSRELESLHGEMLDIEPPAEQHPTVGPRPEVGANDDARGTKAALEQWLGDAEAALAQIRREGESLGNEVEAARNDLDVLNMDLALSAWDAHEIGFPFDEN